MALGVYAPKLEPESLGLGDPRNEPLGWKTRAIATDALLTVHPCGEVLAKLAPGAVMDFSVEARIDGRGIEHHVWVGRRAEPSPSFDFDEEHIRKAKREKEFLERLRSKVAALR
jgi:hypothetical protein